MYMAADSKQKRCVASLAHFRSCGRVFRVDRLVVPISNSGDGDDDLKICNSVAVSTNAQNKEDNTIVRLVALFTKL